MDELKITTRTIKDHSGVVVLDCQGALTETTSQNLQENIRACLKKDQLKIICNVSQLKEITAYGWGYLNGLREYIIAAHGDLQLLDTQGKIKASCPPNIPVTMLIFSDEQVGLDYYRKQGPRIRPYRYILQLLDREVVSGEPFHLKIEIMDTTGKRLEHYAGTPHIIVDRGIVSPSLAFGLKSGMWEGAVVVTGPGIVTLRVWDDQGYGEGTLNVVVKGKKVQFPLEVVCSGCGTPNTVSKTDVFRCVHCNEIYFVDPYGHVITLKPGDKSAFKPIKTVEFRIPGDVNYLNHIRNFIVGISNEEKIDEEKIAQIEMSLDEALANVIEHAYAFDAFQDIHIQLSLFPDRLVIVLRDHGRSFDSDNTPLPDLKRHIEDRKVGGLGRYLIMTLMDEVEYHSDQYTNELRMVKRF